MPSSRVGLTPATAYIVAPLITFPALSYSIRPSKTPSLSALGLPSGPKNATLVTLPSASRSTRFSAMPSSRVGLTPVTTYISVYRFIFPSLSHSTRTLKTPSLSALGFPSTPKNANLAALPFSSNSARSSAMPSSRVGLTPATAYTITLLINFPALLYSVRISKMPSLSALGLPSTPKYDVFVTLPSVSYSRRISAMPSSRVGLTPATAYISVFPFCFPSLPYSVRTSKMPSLSASGFPSTPKYDSRVTLPSASYSQRVSATPELQMSNATKNAPAMLILAIDTSITPHFYLGITIPAARDGSASVPLGLAPWQTPEKAENGNLLRCIARGA